MTRAIILGAQSSILARRTQRALEVSRLPTAIEGDPLALGSALLRSSEPAWIVRAGAWPVAFRAPPESLTGRPLLALGARRRPGEGDALDDGWKALLEATGGDLKRWPERRAVSLDSVWVEAPAALGALLAEGRSLEEAVRALARRGAYRAVRVADLDVRWSERLRVIQAITTLHRGGAERIAVSLIEGLPSQGVDVALAVLDRPIRATLDPPPGTVHLADRASGRAARVASLADLAHRFGADLVHAHLLDGPEIHALAASSVPVIITLHNERPGWPEGITPLPKGACALFLACSLAVRRDAVDAGLAAPVRAAWNAIDPAPFSAARARAKTPDGAAVLLSVANYRPQKRLEELPRILAELIAQGRAARMILVGERERGASVAAIAARLRAIASELDVADQIREVGSDDDVARFYAEADVLVSASAHEGLSLAHLEALAAGLPVITTDVGGARELAAKHRHVRVVAPNAPPRVFADAVIAMLDEVRGDPARAERDGLAPDFCAPRMAERHAELYRRALAPPSRPDGGLVLVTNNFSTGGAQSSARRLLTTLAGAGVRVRAAVIEEQAAYPTPGRAALQSAGIPVFAAPRAGETDPLRTARAVASFIDEEPVAAVLFWNLIPEHKILLADMLIQTPVFDVSPGEMCYASLDRYFCRPRPALPYLSPRDYGALLAGVIVKYKGEAEHAAHTLGAPVHVIPNGVAIPREPPSRRARAPSSPMIVGTLARISPDKKLEQLLAAAARAARAAPSMPPWELRIAGGVERGAEAYAADLTAMSAGLPVRWVGDVDSMAFLRDLDLFALISEPAGCPNASLEAMARGLPVVATDAGGASEQVIDNENGRLVARGDAVALGDAMIELARDEARRRAYGDASFQRAAVHFNVFRMASQYARICLGRELAPESRSFSPTPRHP
jgi:glycosyltransferase involved in cell wall biosynthesis